MDKRSYEKQPSASDAISRHSIRAPKCYSGRKPAVSHVTTPHNSITQRRNASSDDKDSLVVRSPYVFVKHAASRLSGAYS